MTATDLTPAETSTPEPYDVIVIGGGAAGLSAAITLGRARRSVLVIDAGEPRNAPANGVHGFLSLDGISPRDLLKTGRAEASSYGVAFVEGRATAVTGTLDRFEVMAGAAYRARRVVVATGLVDELPDVDGLAARWGKDVIHCPYCHGWEVRDRAIGILATGERALHQAIMFRQWSPSVTLFTHTAPPLTDADRETLAARGIEVVEGAVLSLAVVRDALAGVELDGGIRHPLDVLVVGARMRSRSDLLESLGLTAVEHPMGVGTHLEAAPTGSTAVEGVWVAGNVTDLMAQVVVAAAAGMTVGAQVNAHLIQQETAEQLEVYRRAASPSL